MPPADSPARIQPAPSVRPYLGGMTGDPSLTDDDLQGEIDLVGAFVLEASQTDGQMTQQRIDEILGIADGAEGADGQDVPDAADDGTA